MVGKDRLAGVNPDIPADFDPEIAFAALGGILTALRASYGFSRLGINACRDGHFLAEGWWGDRECASAMGEDANDALKNLVARKNARGSK
jgi:hypothetical protein